MEKHLCKDIKEDTDPLITRICKGITYTRLQCFNNLPITQTTRFSIPLRTSDYTPSATEVSALSLLQDSSAIIIAASASHVVYGIGMPIPYMVPQGAGVRLIHTPHWWVDKSPAEVRAGPHAEEVDTRRAAAKVREMETKMQKKVTKTMREKETERKLEEGLRRQAQGLKLWDEDDGNEQ
jgi:hypothetical protein